MSFVGRTARHEGMRVAGSAASAATEMLTFNRNRKARRPYSAASIRFFRSGLRPSTGAKNLPV
jgi:hypothetical protein